MDDNLVNSLNRNLVNLFSKKKSETTYIIMTTTKTNENELLDKYIDFLLVRELAESTMKQYLIFFKLFPHNNISQDIIDKFVTDHKGSLPRAFVSSYLKFRKIKDLEIPEITGRKRKRFTKRIAPEELEILRNGLYNYNYKWGLMFDLTYWGALRRMEITSITPNNFMWSEWGKDRSRPIKLIIYGKNNRERTVIIPPQIAQAVRDYISPLLKNGEILMNQNIFRVSKQQWWQVVKNVSIATLGKRIKLHQIRHCVQESTHILTLEGWKHYSELKIGESVFSYNLNKNIIELQPLKEINVFDVNDELIHLKNSYVDCIITPEHKCIIQICKHQQKDFIEKDIWRNWELTSIQNIINEKNKRNMKFKCSGITNENNSIGIEKAGLIGWILSDGYINIRGKNNNCPEVSISQSLTANKKKCDYILNLLNKGNIPYSVKFKEMKVVGFSNKKTTFMFLRLKLGGDYNHRGNWIDWLWEWINMDRTPKYKLLSLRQEELGELYKCMMMGDGTNRKDNCNEYCGQNKKRIDFLRALCCLIGKRTNLGEGELTYFKTKGQKKYRTYISNKQEFQLKEKHITKKYYKGKVWCPNIENGTWIAKNNEKIFITGNTSASDFLDSGKFDLIDLQRYLGHEGINTTMIYLHPDLDKSIKKFEEFMS